MSEMVRYKGIIKRLSTKENARAVYDSLVKDGKIDGKWTDFDENGVPIWFDSDDYIMHDDCLYDITEAPEERDCSDDGVNDAERLNDTDYKIHAYFYNGGASLSEMLEHSLPEADKKYENKKVFWAVKLKNGDYMTRNTSAAPALYTTKNRAISTIEKNWPGIVKIGYELVKFGEI